MLAADMGLTSATSLAFCRASFWLVASSISSSSWRAQNQGKLGNKIMGWKVEESPGFGAGVVVTEVLQGHRNWNLGKIFFLQGAPGLVWVEVRKVRFGQEGLFDSPGSPLSTSQNIPEWFQHKSLFSTQKALGKEIVRVQEWEFQVGFIPHLSQSWVKTSKANVLLEHLDRLPNLSLTSCQGHFSVWNNNKKLGMGNVELIPFPCLVSTVFSFPIKVSLSQSTSAWV